MSSESTPSVAGVQTPAFVERTSGGTSTPSAGRVAGVQTPAFVERSPPTPGPRPARSVSPGFRLRPSLSAVDPAILGQQIALVSPGFRLRPSLSAAVVARPRGDARGGVAGVQTPAFVERAHAPHLGHVVETVSPGFRLRPSLSGQCQRQPPVALIRVAGVQTPAFVERVAARGRTPHPRSVSPGFRLRPSLSVVGSSPRRHRGEACRRCSDSGLR